MANWARIKDGRVHETTQDDPAGRVPVGAGFQACPDEVEMGMVYDAEKDEYTEYVHQLTEEEKTQIATADALGAKLKAEAIAAGKPEDSF